MADREELFSKGGKGLFYNDRITSMVGLCVPKKCGENELHQLKAFYRRQAEISGYKREGLTVKFHFHEEVQFEKLFQQPLVMVLIIVILFACLLSCMGTVIELTQIGNRRDIITIVDE